MEKFLKLGETKKCQHYFVRSAPLFQRDYNKNLKEFCM